MLLLFITEFHGKSYKRDRFDMSRKEINLIMDSEKEVQRRYADLTMIIRPDKRYGKVFDVLIELKFVKLKDAKLSAEQARDLPEGELCLIPEIAKQMDDGKKQV